MRKNNRVSILFKKVPPNTNYTVGHWSWVSTSTAEEYIEKGYGEEWNPEPKKETKEPVSDIPEDFPGRNHFIEAGIKFMKDIPKDVKKVDGIGKSTETKIQNYLNDGDSQ